MGEKRDGYYCLRSLIFCQLLYEWTSGDWCAHVIVCVYVYVCVCCSIGDNGN